MNCNVDNDEKKDSGKHSPAKHMLHMIICCALPVIIIFSLPFIGRYSPEVAALLGIIAPFICPIMMGGMMMLMIFGGKKKSNNNTIDVIDK